MIMIIGGAFQGKTKYAMKEYSLDENNICDGQNALTDEIITSKCIKNFHLLVRKIMEQNGNPMEFVKKIIQGKPDIIIITNEIGNGIVPIDKFEREWREMNGRICCYLARNADSMTRIICGMPMIIKE